MRYNASAALLDMTQAALADPMQRKLWGVLSAEIGGGNGLEPLAIGARLSLPVVDADYMGRAFPELQVSSRCSHTLCCHFPVHVPCLGRNTNALLAVIAGTEIAGDACR